MKPRLLCTAAAVVLQLAVGAAEKFAKPEFVSPPEPPPTATRAAADLQPQFRASATVYSIGDPSPEEQLYIEFINRSRANPVEESLIFANTTDATVRGNYDFFGVDLALMQAQFATNPPAPPLAPNAQLTDAARRHSGDMLSNSFQEHVGSDGSTPAQRVLAAGYSFSAVGENVFANARSVFHGHAAFEVDWGFGPGGMQPALGHRNTIHDPAFREIGVGVIFGRNTPTPGSTLPGTVDEVGPQLVTQEFGSRANLTPFITGVVYFDLNGNSFYDLGEGIGGVRVSASGTATQSVTARSGGYALPVAGNGTYTVTFSGEGFASVNREVTVAENANHKVDVRLTYVQPALTGPTDPIVNRPNGYQIAHVPAAEAYQWRRFQLSAPAVEGAENGEARVTVEKAGTYNVFESTTKKSGTFSFHLAHPQDGIQTQSILLNPSFLVSTNSMLRFASRLGLSTENQTAIVQVSTDNGRTWENVYSQSGDQDGPWETSFQDRSVNLSAYVGSIIRVRFAYVPSGVVFIDTNSSTGWFIDDITLENTSEISDEIISGTPNATFSFQPEVTASYVLQARARTGHDFLPWGPLLMVEAIEGSATPPELRLTGIRLAGGQVEIDLDLIAGNAPASFALETKSSLDAAWTAAAGNVQPVTLTRFRLTTTARGGIAFYRVRVQ